MTSSLNRDAIDRASASDRAFLAMGGGKVPEQLAAVLVLEPGPDGVGVPDLARLQCVLASRVASAPRLRQRLVRAPIGAGGPVWVDDPAFDLAHHVHAAECPAPGDEPALLDLALTIVLRRLPPTAPLWSATLVTGLAGGRWALVVVLHHVLADGVGGLGVLAALVDETQSERGIVVPFPRPRPSARQLYVDAARRRGQQLRHVARGWRQLRSAMAAAGGTRPPRAAPTSLVQHTGPGRRARAVQVDLEALRAAMHPWGATANDAVLVALAAAVRRVQSARGEQLEELVVTVPVSGRDAADAASAGNMVSPLLVSVPTGGNPVERLQRVAALVGAGREAATGPPPIALLGGLFRPLARLGGFRWYMNHQHRMHTLVSHVRGPRERVRLAGCEVVRVLPVAVGDSGNTTVYLEVLSYAGELTLVVIADPDHFRDHDALVSALAAELDDLIALPPPDGQGPRSHQMALSVPVEGMRPDEVMG